ncbi:MAG TPA: DedA family protein [Anaerolineales bacterium]|nr:DedA family protein [Anaerolineales bacterium]HLE51007.1 DedA family protein [Anaerolineales bacterium]
MELISFIVDFILHLDEHLSTIIQNYGTWTYLLLFLIIFLETGLVVTPFLPGDSLLFAAGTFAALGALNVGVLFLLLSVAAILGDTVNYWIGHYIGPRAFSGNIRFLKKEYLDRTHEFYERHGGKTIILARFIPIIRTFAPFVAGIGAMTYPHFIAYNVVGGALWVAIFTFGGYYFGNLPVVKENFTLVILAIIFISVLPGVIEFFKERARAARKIEA